MNVEIAIKAGFPAATAADVDHIVWGRTPYPFAKLGLRDFYKAASRYRRACDNGLRLCDMCDRLAMLGDWVCAGCDAALKAPSEAGQLPTET